MDMDKRVVSDKRSYAVSPFEGALADQNPHPISQSRSAYTQLPGKFWLARQLLAGLQPSIADSLTD